MAGEVWRYIPLKAGSGAFHMAADDYFASKPDLPNPVFRLYTWNPFAISLGYHQSADDIQFELCDKVGIDVVRRPTGGRAILHAEEITYSLILPLDHPYAQGGVQAVHNKISEAILLGCKELGIYLTLNKQEINLSQHYRQNPESVACFSSTTEHELQYQGKKVVGSAQKRYSKNLLQHGSILLDDSHRELYRFLNYSDDKLTRFRNIMEKRTGELPVNGMTVDQIELALLNGFSQYFRSDFRQEGLLKSESSEIEFNSVTFRVKKNEIAH
ncbi:MAG: hypothetical protein GF372_10605 [Candidatus Marinimicrobia bacterium]|nr:hypothetical protein [Candidatus Neomarinimicrobiota bacterium]